MPIWSAAIADTYAVRVARSVSTRGARGNLAGSSTCETSPPCAATSSRNLAKPLPSASARSMRASADFRSRAFRPRTSISAPAARVRNTRSAGPSPRSVWIASAISRLLPTALPSGCSMSVSSQVTARPCATPIDTIARASWRAEARSFMNAPLPTFTSRTTAFAPAAIFFDITLEAVAGPHHRSRESRRLLRVHSPPDHSHAERGHLVVGNVALRVPLNKSVDLVRGQLAAVALSLDELNDAHDGTAYGFSGKLSWHLSEKARDSSTKRRGRFRSCARPSMLI